MASRHGRLNGHSHWRNQGCHQRVINAGVTRLQWQGRGLGVEDDGEVAVGPVCQREEERGSGACLSGTARVRVWVKNASRVGGGSWACWAGLVGQMGWAVLFHFFLLNLFPFSI